MTIIKRSRKTTKTYKYLKVYFEYDTEEMCVEWREDFFTKKKTETWASKVYYKRHYSEIGKKKEYIYDEYRITNPTNKLKELFNKTYDEYIFNLREKKLKRITQ